MPLRMNAPLPDLTGATKWFNTDKNGFTADELKGTPTLVHFWAVSCHTCHDIADQVQQWKHDWEPKGIKFISIHHAKTEGDTNLDKISQDIEKMHMDQPVAADNDFKIIDAFSNQFMPAFYLFDSEGKLRHYQAGDRGFDRLLGRMERLVEEEKEAKAEAKTKSE